ncbi:MAG: PP2C family protein-serine/threonine phosphatase [Terracidiphilus sp.]|jgi:hypothetical protein
MPIRLPGRVAGLCTPGVRVLALVLLSSGICHATQAPFPARIGNAVVVLTGPWKFHPGDDAAWANPDFDDTGWGTMALTPPEGSYDPITGSSGFVPGWTARGYAGLNRYAWYRLSVKVESDGAGAEASPLALTMPLNFDDGYEVFVNGRKIGAFGRLNSSSVLYYNSQPRAFPLPDDLRDGVMTIAIRFWMDPATVLSSPDVGGMHGPPMLGQLSAIDAMLRLEWDAVNRTQVGNLLSVACLFLAACLGLTLFWYDRQEPAYLWLGAVCLVGFVARGTVMLGYYTTLLPMTWEIFSQDVVLEPLTLTLWTLFWAYWFGLENIGRIARIAWVFGSLLSLALATIRPPLYGGVIPASVSAWVVPLSLVLKLMLGGLLLWVTYRGIRKQGSDGWLALAPILLTIFWAYQEELTVIHIFSIVRFLGVTLSAGVIANLFMLAIISVLMMRRFIRGQRERELWRLEIEQARQVQQVLIPEALPKVPGFQLASDYRPAQQVGGDFFQIMPLKGGGVLAVIGDVSGKGMPAAMTVSLLVGTVRTLVHFTDDPGAILSAMNVRMLARSHGGFTTCLVLRVAADGLVTVANAGHLSPYCAARELELKNGLPLGLAANSTYPEIQFQLGIGEQMTLMTDGVIEARGRNRELYGFERAAAIANHSAESIGRAAQEFGQEDDITVLTLTRVTARQEPISQFTSPALSPSVA